MRFDRPIIQAEEIPSIARLYGLTEPFDVAYLGGIPNVTYRVGAGGAGGRGGAAGAGGSTLALRICNNGYTSPEHLRCELRALRHLQAHGYGLAPVPVPGTDGRFIQSWHGYRVIATAFIEGVAGDQVPLGAAECRQVGAAVARLGAALRGLDHGLPPAESFRARSTRLLDELPRHASALGWPGDFGGVAGQFDRAMRRLETTGPAGWYPAIHADIWPPNTIFRDGTLVGLIDFDDMSYGPVALDIAAVVCEFAFPEADALDEELTRAALAGFRAAGGVLDLPGAAAPADAGTGIAAPTGAEAGAAAPAGTGPGAPAPVGAAPGEVLADAIEALCASWLAANALHQVPYPQSRSLAERLALLADPTGRSAFAGRLTELWHRFAGPDRAADSAPSPV